jgi:hypothetical protein
LTFKKLYNKVREIEDHDIKYKFIIICDYLKDKIICGIAVFKLCYKIIINNFFLNFVQFINYHFNNN